MYLLTVGCMNVQEGKSLKGWNWIICAGSGNEERKKEKELITFNNNLKGEFYE